MANPNDITAKYYDIVYKDVKGSDVTKEELSLIKSLVSKKDKILDVACGTGRHLVPLAKSGYDTTGIDSSSGMLKILKTKVNDNSKILNQDFFKLDKKNKYDLIILMWNAFNEIATARNDAKRLLSKLKSLLSKDGRILINIDNPTKLNLPNINGTLIVSEGGKKYRSDWKVEKFTRRTNTTVSSERIRVYKNDQSIFDKRTKIKQRWWSLSEIRGMSKGLNLKSKTRRLKSNSELYILLWK